LSKHVLIFGGAGFVGFNLAIILKEKGHKITVVDNIVRRGSELNIPKLKKIGIDFIHADVRNKEDFKHIPNNVDVFLNCAAQPSAVNYENPEFDFANNTSGALNVLEHCRKTGAGLIFWSTNKVYSGEECNKLEYFIHKDRFTWSTPTYPNRPGISNRGFSEELSIAGKDHSIYGVSKVAADFLTQEWSDAFGFPAIVNRFSCLTGPHQWGKAEQGWMTWFAIANYFGLPIEIFGYNGNQVRDYLFTDDLGELIYKQINRIEEFHGEVFNVGGGMDFSISVNEAIKFLSKTNKPFSSITMHPEKRRADQAIYITDNRKVCNEFDWCPVTDHINGYKQIFKWIESNEKELANLYV